MGIIGWAEADNSIAGEVIATSEAVDEVDEVEEPEDQAGEEDVVEAVVTETPEGVGNELIEAIRGLRLGGGDGRCDISKFELHEMMFLFNHAERNGFSDYYGAVREVFAVKHRVMDEVGDIDGVESPNLDELMAFAEGKYEQAFGGE